MSGGSFDYMYERIRENYSGELYDHELNALLEDFCNVLHDLEWWQSGDYSKDQYLSSVDQFKKKWLSGHLENDVVSVIVKDGEYEFNAILDRKRQLLYGKPYTAEYLKDVLGMSWREKDDE